MGWMGSGNIGVPFGVKGDEGSPMGVGAAKYAKWAKTQMQEKQPKMVKK